MEWTYYTFRKLEGDAHGFLVDDEGYIAFNKKFNTAQEAEQYLISHNIPGTVR